MCTISQAVLLQKVLQRASFQTLQTKVAAKMFHNTTPGCANCLLNNEFLDDLAYYQRIYR